MASDSDNESEEAKAEQAIREQWQTEAREQTIETLPAFLQKLANHEHNYGSICIAAGAAALAAVCAFDRSPSGGVTGFQAGNIFWEFYRGWLQEKGPVSLRKWDHMLYPQYADRFDKKVPRETWEWLQKEARTRLFRDKPMHPDVKLHMADIAAGFVPFGYEISDN